jgi:serine/threonine-protein phosphatase 4 regulatory subunit 2
MFLAENPLPAPPPALEPLTTASGGLKLPPFPPRKLHTNATPVSYMTKEQANEMKDFIFAQLGEFES